MGSSALVFDDEWVCPHVGLVFIMSTTANKDQVCFCE